MYICFIHNCHIYSRWIHLSSNIGGHISAWNLGIVMMPTVTIMVAVEVSRTTSGNTSNNEVGIITTLGFHCECHFNLHWTKKETHIFNSLTFCIIQQWGTGTLPPSQEALFIFFLLSLYTFLTISKLPDMDYVTTIKFTQNGTFSLAGINQTTHLNVCNHCNSVLISHCTLCCCFISYS